MERILATEPSAKLSSHGEMPCILVYSSSAHVEYINRIKNDIEKALENKGFRIVYLKDEARDLHIYSDEFMKAAKDCVLGIVILDGFRPNVLFEFGVLMGLEKPIVLLKDRDAAINIRTLYGDVSNNDDCRKKTGLTASEFYNLRNPLIEMRSCSQFSDLSLNISEFDKDEIPGKDKHISKLLSSNIDKIRAEIKKEDEKILHSKTPDSISGHILEMYQEYVARLYSLPSSSGLEVKDVDAILSDFRIFEGDSGNKMPSRIYGLIASLYISAGEKEEKNENQKSVLIKKAIDAYDLALQNEQNPIERSLIQENIAYNYYRLAFAKIEYRRCAMQKARDAYQQALEIRSIKESPMDYARIQNSLGHAYLILAEDENKAENFRMAIRSYLEALKIRTPEKYPSDYAEMQYNLGYAYRALAEVENKGENCKKAIRAYLEALKIRTLDQFPMDYAETQIFLGSAYKTLAEAEDRDGNCRKARQAYDQALEISTKLDLPEAKKTVEEKLSELDLVCTQNH